MASMQRNGHDGVRLAGSVRQNGHDSGSRSLRSTAPDDVVPRLIGIGLSVDAADRFAYAHPRQRISDVLDALEELGPKRHPVDPARWVSAAMEQRWDVTSLLVDRRAREQRVAAADADRRQRETARDAYPAWRVLAERWDATISAALDDGQLARAVDALTGLVPGIGRRSMPMVRAELVAWAVEVHGRDPQRPLADALAADLERGPEPAPLRDWPLPEPPEIGTGRAADCGLRVRIAALGAEPEVVRDVEPALETVLSQPVDRVAQDLDR